MPGGVDAHVHLSQDLETGTVLALVLNIEMMPKLLHRPRWTRW